MQCFYAVVPDGSNTVGQWHMMSPWSVDLVAQELLPWALHKFSGHVRTLELPNLWVPTLRKTWGKNGSHLQPPCFPYIFPLLAVGTWPGQQLTRLIFPTSSPHHVVELIACPRRPADSTFKASQHAAMLGDQWISMLLVGGGQISWCNHVSEGIEEPLIQPNSKEFLFQHVLRILTAYACMPFSRRWPSQSNIVWWRSHKTVWLRWGRMHPAKS